MPRCFYCFLLYPAPSFPIPLHATTLDLPAPGSMVSLSAQYVPVLVKGITIHPDNPLAFDFIIDTGDSKFQGAQLRAEGEKLIKYFLASLAIPDNDFWVNLSPYEKGRIVSEGLGQTDMGRDLLAQDYILKQLTASLIYPEKELGKNFWDRVYAKAKALYGTTEIPVNTFNKVWIMGDKASVYEKGNTVLVAESHLKVMLEEDYLALQKSKTGQLIGRSADLSEPRHQVGSQMVRELILPEIEREVNTGHNFASLRQIFNSLILANWYKNNLKQAFLNQVYSDKVKLGGIETNDPSVKDKIYEQYLAAYKKGVFNYIKEEMDADGQQETPRKYFSGGFKSGRAGNPSKAMIAPSESPVGKVFRFVVSAIPAMQKILGDEIILTSRGTRLSIGSAIKDWMASNQGRAAYLNYSASSLEKLENTLKSFRVGVDTLPKLLDALESEPNRILGHGSTLSNRDLWNGFLREIIMRAGFTDEAMVTPPMIPTKGKARLDGIVAQWMKRTKDNSYDVRIYAKNDDLFSEQAIIAFISDHQGTEFLMKGLDGKSSPSSTHIQRLLDWIDEDPKRVIDLFDDKGPLEIGLLRYVIKKAGYEDEAMASPVKKPTGEIMNSGQIRVIAKQAEILESELLVELGKEESLTQVEYQKIHDARLELEALLESLDRESHMESLLTRGSIASALRRIKEKELTYHETNGGIDLNANDWRKNTFKEGEGVVMGDLDPAMVEEFRRGSFAGIAPVIVSIIPIGSQEANY